MCNFLKQFLIFFLFLHCSFVFAKTHYVIPKGTVIQVYPNKVISTMLNEEKEEVVFLNPSDLWVGDDTLAIPRNTKFKGYISMLKLPVKGINGALSFRVNTLEFPDGTIKQIEANVQYNGQNMIGGNLTPPASYTYTIHRQKPIGWFGGLKGVLQYVPSGDYEYGTHTTIGPKDLLFVVLECDLEI